MKTFIINIHPKLENVSIIVRNGRKFAEFLIGGHYGNFDFEPATEQDAKRIKQFAVHFGDDKSSCHGNWYAHCNGYAMDLVVAKHKKTAHYDEHFCYSLNTYRPYGRSSKSC